VRKSVFFLYSGSVENDRIIVLLFGLYAKNIFTKKKSSGGGPKSANNYSVVFDTARVQKEDTFPHTCLVVVTYKDTILVAFRE
jgi:hypothetical protein